jgi:hypothetical protein
LLSYILHTYGGNFSGAFWQGDNTIVMHWLMQSVDDMNMLRTLGTHGSSGLHFFMVIMLLVMILLYSCQVNYLSYDMGGAFGK